MRPLASLNPQKTPSPPGTFRTHCHGDGDGEHILVPLKTIKGYKGAKEPRCNMCNRGCKWVCITCTPSPDRIFPCHPPKTRAGGGPANVASSMTALSFEQHEADPHSAPRGSRKTKTKRVRPDEDAPLCDDCDESDSESSV